MNKCYTCYVRRAAGLAPQLFVLNWSIYNCSDLKFVFKNSELTYVLTLRSSASYARTIVKLLLESGANITKQMKTAALAKARLYHHDTIAAMLLAALADQVELEEIQLEKEQKLKTLKRRGSFGLDNMRVRRRPRLR